MSPSHISAVGLSARVRAERRAQSTWTQKYFHSSQFKLKKKGIDLLKQWLRGKVSALGLLSREFKPQQMSFCWNGFSPRDCFKHSEAKWRQLPRLFSEALETGTAPGLQCTKVERSSW